MATRERLEEVDHEPQLTDEELVYIRWHLFGQCPACKANIKGWSPGPFNAAHYRYLQENGIDALSGHKADCHEKWRKI